MRKVPIVASALAVAGVIGYVCIQQVDGTTAERTTDEGQTRAAVDATLAFLETLSAEQRQKVLFPFIPQKTGMIARFHRTPDGGVAPGAPAGTQQGGSGATPSQNPHAGPPPVEARRDSEGSVGPGGAPDGPRGAPGMDPPGGFIGERYGQAEYGSSRSTMIMKAFWSSDEMEDHLSRSSSPGGNSR
jgi:hypothetical protein